MVENGRFCDFLLLFHPHMKIDLLRDHTVLWRLLISFRSSVSSDQTFMSRSGVTRDGSRLSTVYRHKPKDFVELYTIHCLARRGFVCGEENGPSNLPGQGKR